MINKKVLTYLMENSPDRDSCFCTTCFKTCETKQETTNKENLNYNNENVFFIHNTQSVEQPYDSSNQLIIIKMFMNNKPCLFLCDTGANIDVISQKWINSFITNNEKTNIKKDKTFIQMAEKKAVSVANEKLCNAKIDLFSQKVKVNKVYTTETNLVILPLGSDKFEGILSIATMAKLGIVLKIPNLSEANNQAMKEDDESFTKEFQSQTLEEDHAEMIQEIRDLVWFNRTIAINNWVSMKNSEIKIDLPLETLQKAYQNRPNYVSLGFWEDTDKQIKNWLDEGIIAQNDENTPFNLPLLAVKQNNTDGTTRKIRICVDFRNLNQHLPMDSYPIPKFSEMTESMRNCHWFSTLDLKSGYNQCKIEKNTQKYMCFTWRRIQYRFLGCPFGMNMIPSQFNRMLAHHLNGIPGVIVYIDDIFLCHRNYNDHIMAVKEVLQRLNDANVKLNLEKCTFGRKQVEYLGFMFSKNGIEVDPKRTKRLVNLKIPTTGKELNSFLAMANYIRQHIPDFGRVTGPLYQLTKVKKLPQDTKWLSEGLPQWEKLQNILKSPIILKYPNPNEPFILRTDACVTGYGGYLFQRETNGEERIIHTLAGTFKDGQKGYSIPKKELYAIIYAVRHLAFYLRGAKFTIQTDAKCLENLKNRTVGCDTVAKWIFELSSFDYDIEHIPGNENVYADLLSRQTPQTVEWEWQQTGARYLNPSELAQNSTDTNTVVQTINNIQQKYHSLEKTRTELYPKYIQNRICTFNKLNDQYNVDYNLRSDTKLPFNADTFTNDWKLSEKYFKKAVEKWGKHDIDLFAAAHNAQLANYCTKEINAFSLNWARFTSWINPPWHLIRNVLMTLKLHKATATICVPFYKNASWLPILKSMTIDTPIVIPKSNDIFLRKGETTVGETPWNLTLLVRVTGKNITPAEVDWTFADELKNLQQKQKQKQKSQNLLRELNTLKRQLTMVIDQTATVNQQNTAETVLEDNAQNLFSIASGERQPNENKTDRKNFCGITTRSKSKKEQVQLPLPVPKSLVFSNPTDHPVLTTPPQSCVEVNTKLSRAEQLAIVRTYHNLTHQSYRTIKNLVQLKGKYNWDGLLEMCKDIENECRHCELKRIEKVGHHPLRSNRAEFAGDIWCMDLIVLPKSKSENKKVFLLHITDVWSGYNFLRPLQSKSPVHVADKLVQIMAEHGCPRTIMYDNGTEFKGSVKKIVENI